MNQGLLSQSVQNVPRTIVTISTKCTKDYCHNQYKMYQGLLSQSVQNVPRTLVTISTKAHSITVSQGTTTKSIVTTVLSVVHFSTEVESSWNLMAHGDAREGKWRGNWWMEWVASTLHTTLEHGVSSITTADAHTSAANSRLNWCPRRFKWTRPFRRKTKCGFCVCAITFQTQSTITFLNNLLSHSAGAPSGTSTETLLQ